MTAKHDVLVIGAGSNGLTAAALLAKAGRSVLVVERQGHIGGTAASDEFHPGFRSAGLHHDASGVAADVVDALALERHGLVLRSHPADVLGLDSGIVLRGDAAPPLGDLAGGDGERFIELRRFLDRVRPAIARLLLGRPLDLLAPDAGQIADLVRRAAGLRRLGAATMMEVLRLPPMSVADFLDEWLATPALKALLALPAVAGGYAGPRSPGTTLQLLRQDALAGRGPRGGGPALVAALEQSARACGVVIRTDAEVSAVRVNGDRARGVVLDGGEMVEAGIVAASCDPKRLFLELLPRGAVSSRLARRIAAFRTRGTTAHVLLALEARPRFRVRPDERFERAQSGASLDDLERAFDAIKYREIPEEPVLELLLPAEADPALAPEGAAVASVLVHFAPPAPAGGWTDERRERLGDRVVGLLERRAPGIAAVVVGRAVRTPADLASRYALPGGQIHHGEHALDQLLVRPAPECARYATPVAGLYLCGSGAHPGGGLTCRPGALAASAILARS